MEGAAGSAAAGADRRSHPFIMERKARARLGIFIFLVAARTITGHLRRPIRCGQETT